MSEIEEELGGKGQYIFDIPNFREAGFDVTLDQVFKMTERRFQVGRRLIQNKPWDFFMLCDIAPDRVHHVFWQYYDPRHPLYQPGNRYEHIFRDYYRFIDQQVGSLLELIPEDRGGRLRAVGVADPAVPVLLDVGEALVFEERVYPPVLVGVELGYHELARVGPAVAVVVDPLERVVDAVDVAVREGVAGAVQKTKVQSWYLDVNLLASYWGQDRVYHHTAPISMNYALHEALRLVLNEGLEARWRRHEENHRRLAAGLGAMGLQFSAQEGHRLWQLNAVSVPDGVDEAAVRKRLLNDFNLEVGAGLGPLKGKIWRVGLMGETSSRANVHAFLGALGQILNDSGRRTDTTAALAAAQ